MDRKIMVYLWIVLLGASVAIACSKQCPTKDGESSSDAPWFQAGGKGDVLAEVNNSKIYMDEFKARMEKQSPYIRARYDSVEKKKEFLDNMIRFELMAQAAIDKGYHKDPEVIRSAKQVMTQRLMRNEFENKFKREDITEEEMKKYYDEHQSEYNKPPMRRAAHILIKVTEDSPEKWREAKQKALEVLKEAKKTKDNMGEFRKLAAKYSEDTSNKNRGGDLGYFASTEDGGPMVKEFSEAAFKINAINDISGPIKTKFGYHIIRMTGKRDKIERTFDQVKGQIQHRLYKEKRTTMFDKFVTDLKAKAKINMNEQLLANYDPTGGDKAKGKKKEGIKPEKRKPGKVIPKKSPDKNPKPPKKPDTPKKTPKKEGK